MPEDKKQSANKLYLVAALAVVFVLTGYFRFFHGKVSFFGQKGPVTGPRAKIEVPAIDLFTVKPSVDAGAPAQELLRTALRNIFSPPATTKTAAGQAKAPATGTPPVTEAPVATPPRMPATPPPLLPTPPPPLPSLVLTGTIIGGKKPLAIINGKFVGKGEWIEGLQVMTITKEKVSLAGGGRSVTLSILEGQIDGK